MIYRLSKFFLLILFFFALDQISKNIIIQLYNIDVENLSFQYLTSINEYINIAQSFYSEKEPEFLNAILDKVAKSKLTMTPDG